MQAKPTVWITGATGGIGRALAQAYGAHGCPVVLLGRSAARLEELASELGGNVQCLVFDLDDPAGLPSAVQRGLEVSPGPIVLVNNAGIAISAPLHRNGDLIERHLRVNFQGPVALMQALLPTMLERGGQVVQIASSAGLEGYAYTSAYCASKHALLGYSKAAAIELAAKGVGVHMICPHFVDSPMTAASVARIQETTGKSAEEARAALAALNPDKELVPAAQVAQTAVACLELSHTGTIWELSGREVHCRAQGIELTGRNKA
ncbi:MAG: SDR family oxidoreductase [Planctomycetota bacterium]